MKKIAFMSPVVSSLLIAGGYKIPETSTNAVALGAANIAHNQNNADAAYYNPAKMIFMSDENHIEADLNYIHINKEDYKPTSGNILRSENENFYIPSLHYVSPKLGNNSARVGVSIVSPGGLSRKWNQEPAKTSAQEFTLEVVEVNPTVAFTINEKLGFAVGFRVVNTKGVVKSDGTTDIDPGEGVTLSKVARNMTGESTDFGYNLALSYQPISNLELGLTYRSKIDLNPEGNAKLTSTAGSLVYNGPANVSVPLPAAINAAIAYTFITKTTLEIVYERTYWSAYKRLDFTYDTSINPTLKSIFGTVKPKEWKDTNTFRFGLTQELKNMTLMAGLVIDEAPAPEKTIGFELPDTDTVSVSLGGRYKINDKIDLGLSALYSMHDKRTVSSSVNDNGLDGEFTDGDVIIISAGLGYKF
ncbi:OmpP1/FadL family transporter [Sulfurimonas autotrophica]|uniref:Membrane protein involved in aromatic hydrocarbon degradation n=1 Tax=Sulfurimonas autotrophica (strain ATCC BAA-671 / DSM 16294 / JCM 11897 / OK10) TaxID=563040 RepID=E0UQK9_SULAO|nr:outer membrane protein transport protein [Sulfurimonas autotrophica]ADN09881.1 membrane protein involved in aromatic hydrocarbon degradation [Sulfurimonas autotrophica DSM 16294]